MAVSLGRFKQHRAKEQAMKKLQDKKSLYLLQKNR